MQGLAVRGTFIYSLATDQYRLLNCFVRTRCSTSRLRTPIRARTGKWAPATIRARPSRISTTLTSWPAWQFQRPTLFNDPLADRNYKSMEFALSRRFSNNWQFQASYSATRIDELFPTSYEEALLDPNHEITPGNQTWEWGARDVGVLSVPAPDHGVQQLRASQRRSVGAHVRVRGRHERAQPRNASGAARHQAPFPHQPVGRAVPEGLRDGRVGELELRANVYNLLNTQVETDVNALSGPGLRRGAGEGATANRRFEAQFRF